MQMDSRAIMAARPVNALAALSGGAQAAGMTNEVQNQNALRGFLRENGAGVMQGDQNALAGLAGFDPQAALGVQGARLNMDATRQQMRFAETEEGRRAAAAIRQMNADEAAERARRIETALKQGVQLYERGDVQGLNMLLSAAGEGTIASLDEFPAIAAKYADVFTMLKGVRDFNAPADGTAAEATIRRLMETGLDRRTAIMVSDRVTVSRDPTTGEAVLLDKATGAPWNGEAASAAPGPVAAPTAPPAAAGGAANAGSMTSGSGEELTFGDAYVGATDAFGLEGFARNAANRVSDTLTGRAIFPETEQAVADFSVLRERLIGDVAAGYDRQPPSWLLRNIEALTPDPATPFMGASTAQSKLRAIARDLQNARTTAANEMRGRITPARRQQLQTQITSLNSALGRLEAALEGFDGPGLAPEVEERLRAYE